MEQSEHPWVDIVPGVRRQTITTGTTMYQMRARLDAGAVLPVHSHPQEQITHVISGRLRMIVAGVAHELQPGDSIYLPANTPHGVEALEDSLVIDTFSPPRDDYLAIDAAKRGQQPR
jgi:quercetin dioxygenase-like cupin family protein